MLSTNSRCLLIALFMAIPDDLQGATVPIDNEFVVVYVQGTTAWTRGQLLPRGIHLALPAEAELVVVGVDERLLKLRGPYEGQLGVAPPVTTKAGGDARPVTLRVLGSLLSSLTAVDAVIVRGHSSQAASDANVIDLTTGGDKCLLFSRQPLLWLPPREKDSVLSLRLISSDVGELIDWPAGVETLSWPANVPIVDATSYAASVPDADLLRVITLHLAPEDDVRPVARAIWMLLMHCNNQALDLLLSLPDDGAGRRRAVLE